MQSILRPKFTGTAEQCCEFFCGADTWKRSEGKSNISPFHFQDFPDWEKFANEDILISDVNGLWGHEVRWILDRYEILDLFHVRGVVQGEIFLVGIVRG